MKGEGEYKKRLWTEEEDRILKDSVGVHGKGNWNRVAKMAGLKRCGKSCRLRWKNYLNPGVRRGDFSEEEEDLIIRLHNLLGNRWSLIAGRLPGRTDNQVKNHWNTHLSKKLGSKGKRGSDVAPSKIEGAEGNIPSMQPSSSSEKPTGHGGTIGDPEPSAIHSGAREATRSDFSTKAVAMDDDDAYDHMGSFWPFLFEDTNLHAPDLTLCTDECALDFIWQGW